jgi:hypothetical protein
MNFLSSPADSETVTRLGHDRFLPNPLKFIIQQSYHSAVYNVDTDSKRKLNSVAFSPQANCTDRATAGCRRS